MIPGTLTQDQFDEVIPLRKNSGPTRVAAKLVLVDGYESIVDASEEAGCHQSEAGVTIRRVWSRYLEHFDLKEVTVILPGSEVDELQAFCRKRNGKVFS